MNDTKIISHGGKAHKCWLPGRWYRYTNHLKEGAIIECGCGRQYRLDLWDGAMWWKPLWNLDTKEGT